MRTKGLTVAMMALALAGCETDATGIGGSGSEEVRVAMRGDDGGQASAQRGGASYNVASSGQASGRVEVEARVWVQTQAGAWVELTQGYAEQTMEASGSDGLKVLTTAELEAGSYKRVRVEFREVRASGVLGLQLTTGLLDGNIAVSLGSDSKATVEREASFRVDGSSSTELQINLNAGEWMSRADAQTRTVAESDFAAAVQVLVN